MSKIFKKINIPSEGNSFLGFHGDVGLHSDITLLGMVRGVSKSNLLRRIVTDWVSEIDIQGELSKYLNTQWLELSQKMNLDEFINTVEKELEERKIPPSVISQIIVDFKHEHSKTNEAKVGK